MKARAVLVAAIAAFVIAPAIAFAPLTGCAHSSPPAPYPTADASDASPGHIADAARPVDASADAGAPSAACQAACARLASLDCPESGLRSCASVLELVADGEMIRTVSGAPMTCAAVAAAATVAAEQALGVCE